MLFLDGCKEEGTEEEEAWCGGHGIGQEREEDKEDDAGTDVDEETEEAEEDDVEKGFIPKIELRSNSSRQLSLE